MAADTDATGPDLDLSDLIRHPVTVVITIVASLSQFLQLGAIDAIAMTIWANASTLFTVTSIASSTIIPQLDASPEIMAAIQGASIAFGVILVIRLGSTILDRLGDRVEDDLEDG
jgi:uncharacterized protein (DUF983 family)